MTASKFYFSLAILLAILSGCSETKETTARVIGLTYNPIIENGWSAKAWYEYDVGGHKFIDTLYFYENDVTLLEGEEFAITYEVDEPSRNKIKN